MFDDCVAAAEGHAKNGGGGGGVSNLVLWRSKYCKVIRLSAMLVAQKLAPGKLYSVQK